MTRSAIFEWTARILFGGVLAITIGFCLAPVILIFGLSFFTDNIIEFPPRQFSFELYTRLADAESWRHAVRASFKIGIPTALLVVLAVTPAAVALERARIRGKTAFEFAVLLPLLMPATGYAVALYVIYLELGWAGEFAPLVLAEAIVASPVAFLIMRAALQRMPHQLDFIAMSLGASRGRALWDVTIRLLRPAMLVAALFTLVNVFNDVLFVTFLGGPETTTISKAIFDSLSYALDPIVSALSAVFIVFMAILIGVAIALQGPRRHTH